MLRLTREVRFAINLDRDFGTARAGSEPTADVQKAKVHNAYAAWPAVGGAAVYLKLAVTVEGTLDPRSQYLLNIKTIDDAVRRVAIPDLDAAVRGGQFGDGAVVLTRVLNRLRDGIAEGDRVRVAGVELHLSPFVSLSAWLTNGALMIKRSTKFEFSAAHRLHNAALSPEENLATFGKCNNPLGHGHNYVVQVTTRADTATASTDDFEQTVDRTLIRYLDHKHLNLEVAEFSEGTGLIPSVENIARVAYQRLRPVLGESLLSVTVWETEKTWAEWSE